ncbi:hypothetical protein NHX12_033444 [Muraenolepis orangiensis]|uniref:alkaline phosphatase n=1 Tax=Muraenolepis orangiensis TaxID=630683 RepID=A0A9Q0E3X7_9TELE|nr:hypothetical protein NHX12_033444 [Muraenolepis orangiensis]
MAGLTNVVKHGLLLLLCVDWTWAAIPEEELHPWYWNNKGQQALQATLRMTRDVGMAKNLILFLGDGKGITTVTATRILKGQLAGFNGEETSLAVDTFPHVALSKTYNVDQQMPDSAGTAKTAYYVWRKSVGIVTTTRVQHASPGANYAHTPDRSWYSNSDLPSEAVTNGCRDIAWQLVNNTEIDVILGGGRRYMFPTTVVDPEYSEHHGDRTDGKNLVNEWLKGKKNAKYVWNKADLDAVDPANTDFLMGLFEPKDCQYEYDRNKKTDPSLTQMMEKAIKILQKNPKGYYLFVEDKGRIDHGHHAGKARKALTEAVELDRAVARAAQITSVRDTLSVVTADHSHVFTVGGGSYRGNSILGLSRDKGTDEKHYTTAVYGNGPGYQIENGSRPDVNVSTAAGAEYRQQAAVPKSSETHAIEDVEQSYIAHAMAFAACLPPYDACVLQINRSWCLHPSGLLVLMGLLLAVFSLQSA